jgi:O-antigen ligase
MKYAVSALMYLFLLQIPFSLNAPFALFSNISLVLLTLYALQGTNKKELFSLVKKSKWLLLYCALIAISLMRSGNPDISTFSILFRIVQLILFLFFAMVMSAKTVEWKISKSILYFVVYPNLLLAVTNVFLLYNDIYFFPQAIEDVSYFNKAVVLSSLGFEMERVQFALARGYNNYSSYTGLVVALGSVYIVNFWKERYRIVVLVSTIILYIIVLLVDSRAAIFYPILITLLLMAKKIIRVDLFKAKLLILVCIAGPLLYYILVPLLGSTNFLDLISRSNSDLQTGNSRFLIWGYSIIEFLTPKVDHWFGYGDFGHFTSGVSVAYSTVFSTWTDSVLKTPHNTFLSILFDTGYIGLVIYLTAFISFSNNVQNVKKVDTNIYLFGSVVLFYHFLSSVTETLSGYYYTNYLYLLSLVMIIILSKINENGK